MISTLSTPAGRSAGLFALAVLLVLGLWLSTPSELDGYVRRRAWLPRPAKRTGIVCDPYAEPGYLWWNQDEPETLQGGYRPLTDACPESTDYLALLRAATAQLEPKRRRATIAQDDFGALEDHARLLERWEAKERALEALSWLRNRTVVIIGDSVDRNGLWQLGWFTGHEMKPTSYADPTYEGAPPGWDERGVPHRLDMPELGLTFTNVFFYGSDDTDDFASAADWRPPGLYEDRVEQLFLPYVRQLASAPDYIQLGGSMWDLALFGRADVRNGISTDVPLSVERLDKYKERLRSMIRATQAAWPGVPLRFRKLHRVGDSKQASGDYTSGMQGVEFPANTNYFVDLRVHQLRQAQEAVARELDVAVFDFGMVFEGHQRYQDKVHPRVHPGGFAYALPLLHHVWLETQGRENWQPSSSALQLASS